MSASLSSTSSAAAAQLLFLVSFPYFCGSNRPGQTMADRAVAVAGLVCFMIMIAAPAAAEESHLSHFRAPDMRLLMPDNDISSMTRRLLLATPQGAASISAQVEPEAKQHDRAMPSRTSTIFWMQPRACMPLIPAAHGGSCPALTSTDSSSRPQACAAPRTCSCARQDGRWGVYGQVKVHLAPHALHLSSVRVQVLNRAAQSALASTKALCTPSSAPNTHTTHNCGFFTTVPADTAVGVLPFVHTCCGPTCRGQASGSRLVMRPAMQSGAWVAADHDDVPCSFC